MINPIEREGTIRPSEVGPLVQYWANKLSSLAAHHPGFGDTADPDSGWVMLEAEACVYRLRQLLGAAGES